MHSRITCMNLAFQLDQQVLTSPEENMESQSVASRLSHALSKFACAYLQILRWLLFGHALEQPAVIETQRPRWSELANAGMVAQLTKLLGADRKTKSIRVLEVDDKRVGSETIWVRHKLETKNWSLEYEGQREFKKLTLKSPNNTKSDKSDTST